MLSKKLALHSALERTLDDCRAALDVNDYVQQWNVEFVPPPGYFGHDNVAIEHVPLFNALAEKRPPGVPRQQGVDADAAAIMQKLSASVTVDAYCYIVPRGHPAITYTVYVVPGVTSRQIVGRLEDSVHATVDDTMLMPAVFQSMFHRYMRVGCGEDTQQMQACNELISRAVSFPLQHGSVGLGVRVQGSAQNQDAEDGCTPMMFSRRVIVYPSIEFNDVPANLLYLFAFRED